jgi:hypothetical protein
MTHPAFLSAATASSRSVLADIARCGCAQTPRVVLLHEDDAAWARAVRSRLRRAVAFGDIDVDIVESGPGDDTPLTGHRCARVQREHDGDRFPTPQTG